MTDKRLEQLIPTPTVPKLPLAPTPWPGITSQSATTVAELLRENHKKHHCFFNDDNFHNHLPHHLLAAYALGCSPELLRAAYDLHAEYQREFSPTPSTITEQNWRDHLGKPAYYSGYLHFFQIQVLQHGMGTILEKYVFSPEANEGRVQMFSRFFSGLIHPLIHFGHGPEFVLPGLAAEGLAMTAVTTNIAGGLFPPEFFEQIGPFEGPHALTILARMLEDPELAYGKGADPHSKARFQDGIRRSGERLRRYYKEWSPQGSFTDKYEELVWMVCSVYGFSGWRKGQKFQANFFILHLVTSSLFMPSIHSLLSTRSQELLLRGFLSTSLTYWVSHGRPSFTIEEFFSTDSETLLSPPTIDPKPSDKALNPQNLHQNPWFPILQSALNHPDEHLLKVQRSFAHYAALYGMRPKGYLSQTELPQVAAIDGTLFLRLASLTGQVQAWVREGESAHDNSWNRHYDAPS